MPKVTLQIQNPNGNQEILLEKELSIGRTNLARLILEDAGLSRLNSTFELHNDEVWVYDENSTNGTFVNGEQVKEKRLQDGDEVKIGNETRIYVEIIRQQSAVSSQPLVTETPKIIPPKTEDKKTKDKPPFILIAAVLSSFLIIFVAVVAVLIVKRTESTSTAATAQATPRISSAEIPLRVIDPLGGEDPDDFDDAIASWETEENEINVADIGEVKSTVSTISSGGTAASELNVSPAFWQKQKDLAMNPARGVVESPAMQIPPELCCGVPKQKRKLAEMVSQLGYKQPMDFAELAQKRLNNELIEMPMATNWYVLEVGGSASEGEFKGFDLDKYNGASFDSCVFDIPQNSEKYNVLKRLADNFDGQKYDLNNPSDRKQMRIRLLRMFNKLAKPILEEIGKAYFEKFQKPLRVTSLTRSMDYQIGLNGTNANSFKVTGKGSLPPHTSGCAFDLARKHMSVDEQNFLMAKLREMENRGILDALREGGANACFHTFIYADGKPPR
jgi:pSer/pThr/pTyr-binding forkhead associated (FHA) protein